MSLCHVQLKVIDKRIGQSVKLPDFQTSGSAGLDLYACTEAVKLPLIPANLFPPVLVFTLKTPNFWYDCAAIWSWSQKRLILGNGVGIVSDYQGEVMISIWNK